jgi:hypothetical protein
MPKRFERFTETVCPVHNIPAYYDEILELQICAECDIELMELLKAQNRLKEKYGMAHGSENKNGNH